MIDLAGRSVFVTGGAGVIGRPLVESLIASGAQVFVGDLKPCPPTWEGLVRYREGDLNSLTMAEVEAVSPEVLIHLAATFERSEETPAFWEENFHHNVLLSHHVMDLMRRVTTLRRVVFASTYLCYDPDLYLRAEADEITRARSLAEDDAVRPRNLVGMAKFAHEKELAFLQQVGNHSFTHVSARIFRGYGRGSRDYVSRTVRSLLEGQVVEAYRVDGEFDYVFSEDSADGLIRLARHDDFSGIVNLGTGIRRSVRDVFAILEEHFPSMVVEFKPSDMLVESSEADVDLLEAVTGWRPRTSLEAGIREIVEFERGLQKGGRQDDV